MLQNSLDPNHYYPSPTHQEAVARLQFLVENRRRAGLLVGESGSGKSLALRVLAQQLKRSGCQAAMVNVVGLEVDELLWQIAVQLGLNPARDLPRYAMWRLISDRVCGNRHQEIATVIMLDDVDQASDETLHEIHRLVHVDCSPDARLTVVLASCVGETSRLDDRLLSLSELRIELEPWQEEDIAMFLATCQDQTCGSEVTFDSTGISRLTRLSGGLPRRVHQLAELALIAAAKRRINPIDGDTVDSVHEELCVVVGR